MNVIFRGVLGNRVNTHGDNKEEGFNSSSSISFVSKLLESKTIPSKEIGLKHLKAPQDVASQFLHRSYHVDIVVGQKCLVRIVLVD
jgi:hypothetical protein